MVSHERIMYILKKGDRFRAAIGDSVTVLFVESKTGLALCGKNKKSYDQIKPASLGWKHLYQYAKPQNY